MLNCVRIGGVIFWICQESTKHHRRIKQMIRRILPESGPLVRTLSKVRTRVFRFVHSVPALSVRMPESSTELSEDIVKALPNRLDPGIAAKQDAG
jgi:hypothetical protein